MRPGIALAIALLAVVAVHLPASAQSSRSIAPHFAHASADPPSQLKQRSGLELNKASLAEAVKLLRETSGVNLLYSPSILPANLEVSCHCGELTVAQALTRLLIDTAIQFSEVGGHVVLEASRANGSLPVQKLEPISFDAAGMSLSTRVRVVPRQGGPIAGVVVDARSEPVSGARVAALTTVRETNTDAAGRFRLANLTGASVTLEITMIGYRRVTQTVAVGDTTIRITLPEAPVNLDEIVVTGTAGAVEKRSIGNAIATVDAGAIMERAPIRSVGDLLQGRVAGVVVLPGTGVAGGGPKIEIRGRSTISLQSEPLIYIDGVRANNDVATGPNIGSSGRFASRLGDLNPEEIESIEIIRGPAAATLYGTEASNGVIQIITKKGGGQRPRFTLSSRQGANWFMNAEGRIPNNWARDPSTGQIIEQDKLADHEARFGRPLFRTGYLQSVDGQLSGAAGTTGLMRYFLAAGYDHQDGIEPTNEFKRLSGRANLTMALGEKFDITANVGVSRVRRDFNLDRGLSLMFALLFGSPATRNGPLRGFNGAPPEVWWSAYETFQDLDRYISGVQMSHRPLSWLSHRLTVGIDQAFEDNQTIIELQPDSIAQFLTTPNNLGRKIVDRRQRTLSTLDYGATANFRLSDRLSLSSAAGAQYYRDFTKSEYAEGQGFPLGGIKLVSAASRTFGGDDYVTNTTLGFYWQEELSLNNRVFLTGAIRADENSAFGPDVRLAKYPKLSGSWVISEEPFWNVGFVDALKLRAAYGKSGLHPVAFSALRTYRPASGSTGSTVTPQSVGNPDLGPEQSGEFEIGFEAGLLGDRLGIDFTYFDKRTKDMIILREIAPSAGFPSAQFVNAARVKSNGAELLLRATPVENRLITWTAIVNLSTNDSEILELDRNNPSLTFITAGTGSTAFTLRHAVGYPIGSRFSKRIVSATFNPATGRAENILCDGGPGAQPMACAQAPYLFIGRGNPKYQGGLTNTVTILGRLTFLAQMDFKTGHVKFDQDSQARCALFRLCEMNFRPEEYDPIDVAYGQLGSLDIGAKWFPDASFLKLREVSVTYDLPTSWANRIRASQGSISLAGRNLYTYAPDYTSLDPESLDFGAAGITNYYEQTTTPQLATALLTLRFSW